MNGIENLDFLFAYLKSFTIQIPQINETNSFYLGNYKVKSEKKFVLELEKMKFFLEIIL